MRRRDVLVWIGCAVTWPITAPGAWSAGPPAKIGWLKITVDLGEGPVSEASMVAWMQAISTRDAERPAPGVAPSSGPPAKSR